MRIKLSDDDRATLGGPEWLEFDASVLMTDEAEVIEESFGIFAEDWLELLASDQGKRPVKAMRAVIWLALTRAGLNVDPAAVRFDLLGIDTQPTAGEVDAGKAQPSAPVEASEDAKPATRSRSPRRSASGRGKSGS